MAFIKLLKNNWLITIIIIIGSLLLTWDLNSHTMLFSDAGRDLLVAESSLKTGVVPLMGIPSSVPRFHQGPHTIWLHMVIYLLFGPTTIAYSLVFAFLSILTLIFVYEFMVLYVNKQAAFVSCAILAVSPLAVAHARVPYHIGPIPLALIAFLFAIMRLWEQRPKAIFWVVLSWTLLMQFELALVSLSLVIVYVLWRKKYSVTKNHLMQGFIALMIGYAPQIIHDLTHPISESQLGAFFAWVGYRVVSLFGVTGEHHFTSGHIIRTLDAFTLYGRRIFSTDYIVISIMVVLAFVATSFVLWKKHLTDRLPIGMQLILISTFLLISSYVAHGGPSEAYFPPFPVLLSMILGYGLWLLFNQKSKLLIGGLVAYMLINMFGIVNHNFFVSTTRPFNYGPAIGEQKEILRHIIEASNGKFILASTDPGSKFPAYLDNYRWLLRELNYKESSNGQVFFIDSKDSPLNGYPDRTKTEFITRDVYTN